MSRDEQVAVGKPLDALLAVACRAGGFDTYEDGVAALRSALERGLITPTSLYLMARGSSPSVETGDSALIENFHEILTLIDNKAKLTAPLADFPADEGAQIELELKHARISMLPGIREEMLSTGKLLPYRRGGGRPTTMPDADSCRQIRREIEELHERGYQLGFAKKRIARRRKLTPRTIETIWRQSKTLWE
jgi:hypothetical protein